VAAGDWYSSSTIMLRNSATYLHFYRRISSKKHRDLSFARVQKRTSFFRWGDTALEINLCMPNFVLHSATIIHKIIWFCFLFYFRTTRILRWLTAPGESHLNFHSEENRQTQLKAARRRTKNSNFNSSHGLLALHRSSDLSAPLS
jgi:hypothetical protein